MKKMNKQGITLIALIITIIVLLILVVVSILAITEGNIIEKARETKRDEKIADYKSVVRAVVTQVVGTKEYTEVSVFATDVQNKLREMNGLGEVTIISESEDYRVLMPENISFTIEEATGKKLLMYIDNYVTRTELEGR